MSQREWLITAIANPTADECILWPFKTNNGYGSVGLNGRAMTASRAALIIHTGSDPGRGFHAAHGPCHNRSCVNPLHMSWKTVLENKLDMYRDGVDFLRLTPEAVILIRKNEAGLSYKEYAEIYNCDPGTISNAARGISWKSVGGPLRPHRDAHLPPPKNKTRRRIEPLAEQTPA